MDWTSFFFGILAGFATLGGGLALLTWRWVRPFMRAAQKRSSESVAPPVMWGSAQSSSHTSSEPKYVWPQSKGKGNGD
jgi:hypothetical protein